MEADDTESSTLRVEEWQVLISRLDQRVVVRSAHGLLLSSCMCQMCSYMVKMRLHVHKLLTDAWN